MQIEVTTLGAGTFDGEMPQATIDDISKVLGNTKETFIILDTKTGPIILNMANIVSIKRKR